MSCLVLKMSQIKVITLFSPHKPTPPLFPFLLQLYYPHIPPAAQLKYPTRLSLPSPLPTLTPHPLQGWSMPPMPAHGKHCPRLHVSSRTEVDPAHQLVKSFTASSSQDYLNTEKEEMDDLT